MPTRLEIEDDQLEPFKEFYSIKANKVLSDIQKLQDEYKKLEPILIQLGLKTQKMTKTKTDLPNQDFFEDGYSNDFSWGQKVMWVLNQKQGLTPKQVMDEIVSDWEPGIDKKLLINSLPATMSVYAGKGWLRREFNDKNEYIYFLPNVASMAGSN